jgi:hypothetical protein
VEQQDLRYTKITRSGVKDAADVRMRTPVTVTDGSRPTTREKPENVAPAARAKRLDVERRAAQKVEQPQNASRVVSRQKATTEPAVRNVDRVRSTRNTFVASKRNYEKMRKVYDRSGDPDRSDQGKAPARTKSTKVAERASDDARRVVALKGESPKKSSSGSSAKRTKL